MIYPESFQYTRAYLALGCVRLCVHLLSESCADHPDYGERERKDLRTIREQIAKVSRWENACTPLRRPGKPGLSAGAMRDIDAIVETVFTPPIEQDRPEANFAAMAAALWATCIFLQDARNCSKLYAVGLPWYRLRQTTETLANMFRQAVPDCDVTGTALYARALEGTGNSNNNRRSKQ